MKKHSNSASAVEALNPEPLNMPARARVRYVGFEGINGGRRLNFSVKRLRQDSVDVTFEVSDTLFNGAAVSIQDAAPMAYEKLVELFATKDAVGPQKFFLTESDIPRYVNRHLSSQKRAHLFSDGRRRSDVAALIETYISPKSPLG